MIRLVQRKLILPRGDTGSFTIPVLPDFNVGDVAVFAIFNPLNKTIVFKKQVEIADNKITIQFSHNDTVNLPAGKYLWDIKAYLNPEYVDDKLVNGDQIDSYYASYKLPECQIRETADDYLMADDAPTSTLSPNQLDLLSAILVELRDAVQKSQENVTHYPTIIDNYWHIWDANTGEYVNTNVMSGGVVVKGTGVGSAKTIDFSYEAGGVQHNATQTASGAGSFSEGINTIASGIGAHAQGNTSEASGINAHAEGSGTKATNYDTHAEGYYTQATGPLSHAEGSTTVASGNDSHAEGSITVASGNHSHAEGDRTTASGDVSHAEGIFSTASGNYSHAENYQGEASGENSHAEGYISKATKNSAHAEGYRTEAKGNYSHSEGYETVVTGEAAHAEGHQASASKASAHAEGYHTQATNNNTHAQGYFTVASGLNSHAQGEFTNAVGKDSHAEGYYTYANGINSHSEGYATWVNGDYSHAGGYYTIASGNNQYVSGKYNIEDLNNLYAVIVGIGTYNNNRLNGYTLDWSGNGWYAGKVSVTDTTPVLNTDLTSKLYVDTMLALKADIQDIPDISGKADKVSNATSGNFASLDANGNLIDSGHKHSDYLTEHQDISGKQDKLTFDAIPTQSSNNPVTSGGIKSALSGLEWSLSERANMIDDRVDDLQNDIAGHTMDIALLESNITSLETNKQDKLTFDITPRAYSNNPVTSGGIYNAITNIKTMQIHICTNEEYNSQTGIPIINSPDTKTFYLVPGGEGNNLYIEWVYINNTWEQFGSATIDLSDYAIKNEIPEMIFAPQPLIVTVLNGERAIRYNTGELYNSSAYNASDYVDLSGIYAIRYKRTKTTASSSAIGIAFYDTSKTYANSGVQVVLNQKAFGYAGFYDVIVPEGAAYVRFTMIADTQTYGDFEAYGLRKTLTFDNTPTANSTNPVTSGGVYRAITNIKTMGIHICTSQEYNSQTGIPTVASPDTKTFYLVPGGEGSNLYIEWVYVNNAWQQFGSATIDLSGYALLSDIPSNVSEFTNDAGYLTQHQDISGKADKSDTVLNTTLSRGRKANTTIGEGSFAFGIDTTASGAYSHAQGNNTSAARDYSHAEGFNTKAHGYYSHAEGHGSIASNTCSHAEGSGTIASAICSHAEGQSTTASEAGSHAEGTNTVASGNYSHAEGGSTVASGLVSHAEGGTTTASGDGSHAEGTYTVASGVCSHAEGTNTVATGYIQHVSGKYNIQDLNNKYAEIVGIGTYDNARANGRTLDWNGNAQYAGKVSVGNTIPTKNNDLTSKAYVDSVVPTNVSDLSNDVGYITDEDFIPEQLTAMVSAEEKFIAYTTGSTNTASYYNASEFVDVSDWYAIRYKRAKSTVSTTTVGMAFYDDTQTFIPDSGVQNVIGDAVGYAGMYDVIVPQGAKYARFSILSDTATYGIFELYGISREVYELGLKVDKVVGAVSGNFAALDSNGNLADSGVKASDYLTKAEYTIDSSLDSLSDNPVKNKTITAETQGIRSVILSGYAPAESPAFESGNWKTSDGSSGTNPKRIRQTKATQINSLNYYIRAEDGVLIVPYYYNGDTFIGYGPEWRSEYYVAVDALTGATGFRLLVRTDPEVDLSESVQETVAKVHFYRENKIDKVSGATAGNFAALDASGSLIDSGNKASDFVTDVQVNGTSVLNNGIANIPKASSSGFGVIKAGGALRSGAEITGGNADVMYVQSTTINGTRLGTSDTFPITPSVEHSATFYGLAKAAGDATQATSENAVGTYTDDAKASIRTMLGAVGNANYATSSTGGVVKIDIANGLYISPAGQLYVNRANDAQVKTSSSDTRAITPTIQHSSTFYGLAKAAGDTTQSSSSNAVGSYTTEAKAAIQTMLGVESGVSFVETISGTDVTIPGIPNTRYVCGEVSTISITPPSAGTIIVRFTSGTTAAVLTLPSTVKMPDWWNGVSTNYIYQICIQDGVYGSVMAWPV